MASYFNRLQWKILRRLKVLWERMNGYDFSENHSLKELGFSIDEANIYSASPSYDLDLALKDLDIQPKDSILDYGAGKGAAMVTMSKYNFCKIHGVELSSSMFEIGQRNLKKLGLQNTKLFLANAADFKDLEDYTVFYLFNPFPAKIVDAVLQNIAASHLRNPRKITVLYYLPAFRHVFQKHPHFKFIKSYPGKYYELQVYAIP